MNKEQKTWQKEICLFGIQELSMLILRSEIRDRKLVLQPSLMT